MEGIMSNKPPLLQLDGIRKTYPGVVAVDQASLELRTGEVHALVGENGAGKSTLIKVMAGIVHPDQGVIRVNGEPVEIRSGSDAFRLGLSFIHQELNLVTYLSAAENIFLGRDYPKTKLGGIDWKALNHKARTILAELGVDIPVDIPVCRLSRGGQSMVSLARAFADEAMVYVMDEPTASLTDEEIRNLFAVIAKLKSRGCAVLYVSHRLEEIFEICDRVTVMRDGQVIGTREMDKIDQAEMIQMMIGRELKDTYPASISEIGEPVLKVENLAGGAVKPVNFILHAGEILGFAGLVGSGRTDIMRMIFGADKITSGTITLNNQPYEPKNPAGAIKNGVLLVPEERRTQGLVLKESILRNITMPHLKMLSRRGFVLNWGRERKVSESASRSVRLKASSLQQKVGQLSGGNQQKVVFARWVVDTPNVLILDEPSRGVDVGARFEIYKIIRDLAAQGVGILLISSDLPELLGLADRVVVMREGQQMATLPGKGLDQETVLRYCYGEEK
jgi:ABC-type sugar transport system ATPase subunit